MKFREFKAQVQADLTPSGLWHDELVVYFRGATTDSYQFNAPDIDIMYTYRDKQWGVMDKTTQETGVGFSLSAAYDDLNGSPF